MIQVTLTWAEAYLAATVGVMRRIASLKRGLKGVMLAHTEDHCWDIDIEGAAGEHAAAKGLDRHWRASVNAGKLPDVGDYQIRTASKHHYQLKVCTWDSDDEIFILVTGRIPTFCLRGWLRGHEAKREEWLRDPGELGHPIYLAPQSALHPIETIPAK